MLVRPRRRRGLIGPAPIGPAGPRATRREGADAPRTAGTDERRSGSADERRPVAGASADAADGRPASGPVAVDRRTGARPPLLQRLAVGVDDPLQMTKKSVIDETSLTSSTTMRCCMISGSEVARV